jgi:hypothetical protein
MTKKTITIKSLSSLNNKNNSEVSENVIDQWVNKEAENNLINEENKIQETRLTVLIPTYLHRRIKKHCASHSISMKDKILQVFKENFPET